MDYEEFKLTADLLIESLAKTSASMKDTADLLDKGVSYNTACSLASSLWTEQNALELKTQFMASSPKTNAKAIRNFSLERDVVLEVISPEIREITEKMNLFIKESVAATLEWINSKDIHDEVIQETHRDFLLQVTRYVEYLKWGVYEVKEMVIHGDLQHWGEIPYTDDQIDTVSNGNYLFLTDLPNYVAKACKDYLDERVPPRWSMSISGLNYTTDTIRVYTTLIKLFGEYLCKEACNIEKTE